MAFVILTSSYTLDYAGVPTYTATMADELEKRGHEVHVFSPKSGSMEQRFKRVHTRLETVPKPDVIVAQHTNCAVWMRHRFPNIPFIFSAHGVLPDIEQPPRTIAVDWWTAINTQVRDNLVRQYVDPDKITILRDFVNTDEFAPRTALREQPVVLFISNYKKWKNWQMLSDACASVGVELRCIGSPYGRSRSVQDTINEADLVVSWGRGILEGMACGRPVISFDKELGDGYLDEHRYFVSRERNFSGYECLIAFTKELLVKELECYTPETASSDGQRNRTLAMTHHGHVAGVDALLDIIHTKLGLME